MSGALVLNASYEPLCVVSERRAVVLVLSEKADALASNGRAMHAERISVPIPSVIRLRTFVRVPFQRQAPLNRRTVFARDAHRCQYCGDPAENLDHVVPRSRGGLHVWENVVACCRPCNTAKGDRLLEHTGMTLTRRPVAPRHTMWVLVAVHQVPADWEPWLQVA